MPDSPPIQVEQCDRLKAAPIFRAYEAENYAVLCEKGSPYVDRLIIVRSLAEHRIATAPAAKIPPAIAQALYRSMEREDMTISVNAQYHLASALGLPIPPNVQRHADFWKWENERAE